MSLAQEEEIVMAKEHNTIQKQTSTFSNANNQWQSLQPKTKELLTALASRKDIYNKLPPETQQKWRESASDPLLKGAWKLFLSLATFFGIEVPR